MGFNEMSYTALSKHYLLPHPLWRMHFTMCAQCNVIMMIKQQRTRLKLRACIETKSGHFELKL